MSKAKFKNCKKGYASGAGCISFSYMCKKDYPEGVSAPLNIMSSKVSKKKKEKPAPPPVSAADVPKPSSIEEEMDKEWNELKDKLNPPTNVNNARYKEDVFRDKTDPQDVAKIIGVSVERAGEIQDSLYNFTLTGYSSINGYINGIDNPKNFTPEKIDKIIKDANNINEFIDKSPKYKGPTYRAMANIPGELDTAFRTKGAEITLKSLSSWTKDPMETGAFAGQGDNGFLLVNKNNKRGVGIESFSQYPEEQEVLMRTNTRIRVKSITKDADNVYGKGTDFNIVEIEEID